VLGKILRIDLRLSGGNAYGPGRQSVRRYRRREAEIFVYGLRNPWRFSFDRDR
jgi:hypothetical protein